MRDDEALQLLNRIVERLLDGWGASEDLDELLWISDDGCIYEEMSDGEAAIIRQHQEKS